MVNLFRKRGKNPLDKSNMGMTDEKRERISLIHDMLSTSVNYQDSNEYAKRVTPENIQSLRPGQVFVFGSNIQGAHGGGAAALALRFGAIDGQAEGMQGDSYAIVSMEGLEVMREQVERFIQYAKEHPERTFLVTAVGCGIAGFEPKDVAPLFAETVDMENVFLPKSFWNELKRKPEEIVKEVREYVQSRWTLGRTHGVSHWDRVYENGRKLLTPEVNPLVVGLFAYLHDSCRKDDGGDFYHGQRAAEWIETLRGSLLKALTEEEFSLLKEACRLHTVELKTGNPTIDACFDADRLDLWRVGVIPSPDRLATEKGREIARNTNYEPLMHKAIWWDD